MNNLDSGLPSTTFLTQESKNARPLLPKNDFDITSSSWATSVKHKQEYWHMTSKIYCVCRGTDDGRAMVCCDSCMEWFHADCVSLSELELEKIEASEASTWFCAKCIQPKPIKKLERKCRSCNRLLDAAKCKFCTAEKSKLTLHREKMCEKFTDAAKEFMENADDFAESLEHGIYNKSVLFDSFMEETYNTKCRSMLMSLRNERLTLLREKLSAREWSAEDILDMGPNEFSGDRREEVKRIRKEELDKVVRKEEKEDVVFIEPKPVKPPPKQIKMDIITQIKDDVLSELVVADEFVMETNETIEPESWSGEFEINSEKFQVKLSHAGGRDINLSDYFTPIMLVSGRITPLEADKYLSALQTSQSREVFFFTVQLDSLEANSALFDAYKSNNKYAVLKPSSEKSLAKDIYLLPFCPKDEFPEFFDFFQTKLPSIRSQNILVAVIVALRPDARPSPTSESTLENFCTSLSLKTAQFKGLISSDAFHF